MPMNQDYPTHVLAAVMSAEPSWEALIGGDLYDRGAVVEWVKGSLLTRFSRHLSAADYQTFLRDYQRRLFEILPDERPFFYPFKRLFIWARR
ncbi:MAG: hypothetical protein H7301_07670 [Cryobacterium sp.]|nr:hypothetical protein [Oligoflexia bacterium]